MDKRTRSPINSLQQLRTKHQYSAKKELYCFTVLLSTYHTIVLKNIREERNLVRSIYSSCLLQHFSLLSMRVLSKQRVTLGQEERLRVFQRKRKHAFMFKNQPPQIPITHAGSSFSPTVRANSRGLPNMPEALIGWTVVSRWFAWPAFNFLSPPYAHRLLVCWWHAGFDERN